MNPLEMAKILNHLVEHAEIEDRELSLQAERAIIRCEQNCPACDLGNHLRIPGQVIH